MMSDPANAWMVRAGIENELSEKQDLLTEDCRLRQ